MGQMIKCVECEEGSYQTLGEIKEEDTFVKFMCGNCGLLLSVEINIENEED